MTLADVRDFISSLEIAEDEHVYMGKLDAKKEKSIGCYHLRRSKTPHIPLGGAKNISYDVKPISILIHWSQSPRQTEEAAQKLYDALIDTRKAKVNGCSIQFCRLLVPEPQDVGTDDKGIYEAVIEVELYTERKR